MSSRRRIDLPRRGPPAAPLRPVPGLPIVRLLPADGPPRLALADLHLGLGGPPHLGDGPPEASGPGMAELLVRTARAESARGIVIAGDVKHPIFGSPAPLRPVIFRFFAELLGAGLDVDVVLGNHDVGLVRDLPREVTVHPSTGAVFDGVGVFHGHRWPSEEVLSSDRLLAGHLHPGYRLAPSDTHPRGKERCWVRVLFPEAAPPRRRTRRLRRPLGREMVVLPAFNPIAGCEALNRRRPGPGRSFLFARFLALGPARAYLLDGTDIGPIPTLSAGPRPGSPRRASPGR